MQIKVKKLDKEAVLPKQGREGDAGFDIVALDSGEWSEDYGFIHYKTGLSIQPDEGYHVEIFPRSSISNYDLVLANSIPLIDQTFRGELRLRFRPTPRFAKDYYDFMTRDGVQCLNIIYPLELKLYKKGDRIAQLVVRKTIYPELVEVENLDETIRGENGFGSSGC